MSMMPIPNVCLSVAIFLLEEGVSAQSSTEMMELFATGGFEETPWEAGLLLFLIISYAVWRLYSYSQDDTVHNVYLNCEIESEEKQQKSLTQGYVCDIGSHDARLVTSCNLPSERVTLSLSNLPGLETSSIAVNGQVTKSQAIDKESWLVDVHFDDDDDSRIREMMSVITKNQNFGDRMDFRR